MFPGGYNHFNPGHYQPQQSTYQQTYSLANDPAAIPPPSSIHLPGPNPNSTAFQQPQERRNGRDTLLSMRKYRSLDGGQFLGHLDPFGGTSTAYNHDHSLPAEYMNTFQQNQGVLPTRQSTSTNFDNSQLLLTRAPEPAPSSTIYQQQLTSMANYPTTFHPQMTLNTTTTSLAGGGEYRGGIGGGCNNNPNQMPFVDTNNYGIYGNLTASSRRIENNDDDPLANAWLYYQPISAQSILQQIDFDPRALRREFCSLCDRYNYLAATVRSFWAPELQREKQKRKEEAIRADQMEQRLSQKNSETQILRVELDRRREDEDSGIGRPLSHPRDFTDHTITLHEWQTLKTKLERSELSLAERTRELQSAELRAKCAEEQKEEVERRSEILSKSNSLNEAQLKLLHEDLNVLRGKLELKNQQLEMREKANKKAEAEMDSLRMELKESQQNAQDAERRIAQLTHRIDQMEREMREQNSQMEMLKQRLLQQPSTKAEIEFQQKLENALEDRRKLEQLIDQLRQQNETERQQQLQQFMQERDQLQANIAYLKKELADRHVLISSQSEKISQLDNAVKNATANQFDEKDESKTALEKEGMATTLAGSSGTFQQAENTSMEMERLHREVDRLLKMVQQLDREKAELMAMATKKDGGQNNVGAASSLLFATDSEMTMDERVNSLRQRIRDLEEALRESVECTAEREKSLSEQKRLVEKLSNQVNELFESSGSAAAITSQQRQTRDALAHLADAQKQLEEERQQRQRQVSTIRKELGMALVAEKEAAISLVQHSCPMVEAIPGLREKLDAIQRQKEALKHALLMSTADEDPSTNFGLQIGGNSNATAVFGNATSRLDPSVLRSPAMVQPGRPMSAAAALLPSSYAHSFQPQQQSASSAIGPAPALSHPIRIQTAGYGSGAFGISAPASLNLYTPTGFDDFGLHQADEEGIWA